MIYLILNVIFWIIGFLLLFRIRRCKRNNQLSLSGIKVSIIIPALNEEINLPSLIDSIKKQSFTNYEVIIAVTPSKDKTLEIANNSGFKVVVIDYIPEDWLGKPYACYKGWEASNGNTLMFLDADTCMQDDGLKKIIESYLENKGALSVQPYHRTAKFYEQFSAVFSLISVMAMGSFTILGKHINPAGLFGPCIVISRKDYMAVGGHEAVKGEVVEDMALGAILKKQNINLNCLGGKGAIDYRMYPGGTRELIDGWTKNFAAGAQDTSIFLIIAIVCWIGGALGVVISIFNLAFTVNVMLLGSYFALYLAFTLQIIWILKRIGNYRIYTALFYPVYIVFFVLIFLRSIFWIYIKKKVKWKGMLIDLKEKAIIK
jgi:4,4'-diaponeurosporenoate glycosyltransferase